ncbi:MAG: TVP38/TMEM64 family inner membrane protein YdjZ [Syntrophorhabdus sp. PtaU1.Bin050]|nr:MAG: TVP38/TMEM64 family inner membrane protein YdjZ [Syntrophorhabdus sp. PtaU1.Bin050]
MNDHSIVKSRILSLALRGVLYISILALIIIVFYLYQEGGWREIIRYYRTFLSQKRLGEFIASFGPFAALIFVITQAVQVVAAPIPGEMTGFVGGFLFGKVWGIILSTIGLTIGSLLAFGVAKKFGMRIVERVVKKQYIAKFNFFVTHKGLYITFVMYLLPGFPKDALCYFLGLTRLRFLDFVLMNVFGRLPGTMMLTLQGNAVREGKYETFFWLLAVTVILIVLLYFARNYIIGFVRQIVRSVVRSAIKRKKKRRKTRPV